MAAKFGLLIDAKTKGENNIKRLGNSMQGVEGKAKNLGMAVRGAGLAFKALFATAAVGSIIAIGKSAIDTADAFGKLSTRTGIAADKLLAYVNAGKLADVSQGDLETGLRTLARTQVEASEGVKTYADAYAKLGIAVKNADGSLKPSDQLLGEIADKFQDLPNGPEKAAVAMDIFGRSGQKMITMLNGGQESLERFGFELSENFARNSERFNDQITEMGIELQKLQMQVMDDLLPSLIDLANVFIDITKATTDATRAFLRFFNIGDDAVLESNTLQIQALNKSIARNKRLLKEQQAEMAKGGGLFGIRPGQIKETERLIAEFEKKREKLRREINDITRVSPEADLPTADRLDFVRTPRNTSKEIEKSTDKAAENTKEMSVDLAIYLADLESSVAAAEQLEQEQFAAGAAIAEQLNQQDKLNQELTETDRLFGSIKDTVAIGLANAIEGLIDGTKTLGESLTGILRQIGSMILQTGMQSFIGPLFENAKGNVFAQNKIVPFAYGGVVNKPTLFPMANGMGLMGEAGPEAIMPLRRGRGGRLGVEASGGGVKVGEINITVENKGEQLSPAAQKSLAGQVQGIVLNTLANERRSGGML